MNFFVLFTFFASVSALAVGTFFWMLRDAYGSDADGLSFFALLSIISTILWTGLALGVYFA